MTQPLSSIIDSALSDVDQTDNLSIGRLVLALGSAMSQEFACCDAATANSERCDFDHARMILAPLIEVDQLASQHDLLVVKKWGPMIQDSIVDAAIAVSATQAFRRSEIARYFTASDARGSALVTTYWRRNLVTANLMLLAASTDLSKICADTEFCTAALWSLPTALIAQRSVWLTAVAAKFAATAGEFLARFLIHRLQQAETAVEASDAVFGLCVAGYARPSHREMILNALNCRGFRDFTDVIEMAFQASALLTDVQYWIDLSQTAFDWRSDRTSLFTRNTALADPSIRSVTGFYQSLLVIPTAIDTSTEHFLSRAPANLGNDDAINVFFRAWPSSYKSIT